MPAASIRDATRDVWANNLEDEMRILRRLIDDFPFVSMDCEFPAVVARPIGKFKTSTDYHYQTMRCNVDILKLIQLGITLTNAEGQVPAEGCTWQFNFYFNPDEDTYAPDTIEILAKSGIDFARHRTQGINPNDFAEVLITSGLVLFENITWIGYHSGYDFGYLMRNLTGAPLPLTEDEFFSLLKIWFPNIFDIKYIIRQCKPSMKGGLQELAQEMGVGNTPTHSFTSGYASFLSAMTFKQIMEVFVRPSSTRWDESQFNGNLYGLGPTYINGVVDNSRSGMTSAERERPPMPLPSIPPPPPPQPMHHHQGHVLSHGNHPTVHQQHAHAHGHHGQHGPQSLAHPHQPQQPPAHGPSHYPHPLMALPTGAFVNAQYGQMGVPPPFPVPGMAPLFRMDR